MSLSRRLHHFTTFYNQAPNVWDIGCDHGLLGLSFTGHPQVKCINLVDPSVSVVNELLNTLADSYITIPSFIHVLNQKGQDLKIPFSNQNCIYIAGMGGKEIQEILIQLLPQLSEFDRVIISPHRKVLELRQYLHHSDWRLVHEDVLSENEQFYPFLVMELNKRLETISLYGTSMWHSEIGRKYREHQLKFFSSHQDSPSKSYTEYLLNLF